MKRTRLRPSFIDTFDRKNGLNFDEVFNITKDADGALYFSGIGTGTTKFEHGKFTPIVENIKYEANQNIYFVKKDSKNRLWIAEDGPTIIRINPDKTLAVDTLKTSVSSLIDDTKRKTIWLGGRGYLVAYTNGKFRTLPFAGDDILALYLDEQNRLWLGAKGLWMYDGQRFYDFSKATATENVLIQAIEPDKKGFLYLGTIGKGIRKVSLRDTPALLEKININEGLTNESIMDLKLDNEGKLWISSFGGILRMDITKPKMNNAYPTRIFDLNDGIIQNSWRVAPMQKDNEGNIWVGTPKGVMRFRVKDMVQNNQPPKVHITQIQLFQRTVNWAKEAKKLIPFSELPDQLSLDHNQNFLTFFFTGISLSNPEAIVYSSKLEGVDEKWSPLTLQNNINYSTLDAGTYTFRVKAMNSDGVWSTPTAYTFTIRPAFHSTWWARLAMLLLGMGLVWMWLKNREKQIKAKNALALQLTELKLKALQSQMNPHFLFNSLNSIQNYILTNRSIDGAKYLSKFSKLVRRIMENSNHQYLRFEEILDTLRMYVEIESFRFSHEFHYTFDIADDEGLLDTQLPSMLLQPHVENAIWHGLMPKEGEKKLVISAYREGDYLYCQIEDNGVGRGNGRKREGHISRGQEMTKGIFDSLSQKYKQATFGITDLVDTEGGPIGTRVSMVIPIAGRKG